jgi:hypothetical protein
MPFEHSTDLLNIFEVDDANEGRSRHFVCFLMPSTAERSGIPDRAIVGEFTPGPEGVFQPDTFQPNALFLEAFVEYMNRKAVYSPELVARAKESPGEVLFLVDPRVESYDIEPEPVDVLGGFQVDEEGVAVADSFRHNPNHVLFNEQTGPSGILTDTRFYGWLHDEPVPPSTPLE